MGSACSTKKTTAVEKAIPVTNIANASVASVDRTVENPVRKGANEPPKYNQANFILEEVNTIIKAKALEAIRKDDSFIIKKLLKEGLKPYERVGNLQNNQSCLHLAAKLNAEKVLHDLLTWIDEQDPLRANSILNLQDSDGNSPAMLAGCYDSDECLVLLLNTGRVDLKLTNKSNQNIVDITKAHSHNCEVIISSYILKQAKDPELNKLIDHPDKLGGKSINELDERAAKGRSKLRKTTVVTQQELEAKMKLGNQAANKIEPLTIQPEIKKRYEQILNMFEDKDATQVCFKDLQFPAEAKSITTDTSHKYYMQYFEKAPWLRASEIIGVDVNDVVLYEKIDPNEISQGLLGVCYFLAAISSLAEYPSRLMNVINNKKANPFGVYSMTFYMAGVPKEIIVDDFFPCFPSGKPLFSRPKGNELWVLILEKGWAKAFGNYCVTEAGWIDEALSYLLGAPTDQIVIDENTVADEMWNQLMIWDRERYVMGCATRPTAKKEDGLIANHAYTILSVHNVSGYKLVKLRNPWGKFEWNGDFSDSSKLWTDTIKQEVGYSNQDDGVFVMKLEDFMKNYEYYTGCFYKDKYVRGRAAAENTDGKADYFELSIEKESFVNIEVHQTDKRLLQDSKKKESDYRPVEMILCKKEGDEFKKIAVNQCYWGRRSCGIKGTPNDFLVLEPGTYVLRVKMSKGSETPDPAYTVTTYSDLPVSIQRVKREKYQGFLHKYLLGVARADPKRSDLQKNCYFVANWESPYMYIYLENRGESNEWNCTVKLENIDNVRIAKVNRLDDQTIGFKIAKDTDDCAILKKINRPEAGSAKWKLNYTWA